MNSVTKILYLIVFLFIANFVNAQGNVIETETIESSVDSIDCDGVLFTTVFYLVNTKTVDNGTMQPDTTRTRALIRNGDCPADSSVVAELITTGVLNDQQELAYHTSFALLRNEYLQRFNVANSLYTAFTGSNLFTTISKRYYSDYRGIYRIFKADNSSFFAKLTQVPSGRLRMSQIVSFRDTTLTGITYVLNPRSALSFQLVGLDGVNYEFTQVSQKGDRKRYLPAIRVGQPTSVRIVKVTQGNY